MFRCTDCYKEYPEHPGYCECGNDQFEEIVVADSYDDGQYDDYNQQGASQNGYYNDGYSDGYSDDYSNGYDDGYYEEQYQPVPKLKKRPSRKKTKKNITLFDKIGIGVFCVCIILSILALIFIGAGKNQPGKDSSGKVILQKNYSIPVNIDEIWDNTLAASGPSAATVNPNKILNTKLKSIDSELNAYLISLAQAMINSWDRSGITGNGVTQMEFKIQSDGTVAGKKIYKFSGNKSLDGSVAKIISDFGKFQTPPSSYKEEIIIIAFSSNNGAQKAYFPNVTVK
ncbi:MAG: TonB C-terminal domain-containing protein [Candidatus Gastranaerophilales bacterium]|nr:TonB C-terminal domain-containing protein [Candidatus Gastranaerophilales bacterium]